MNFRNPSAATAIAVDAALLKPAWSGHAGEMSHLAPVSGSGWHLWRTVLCRSAGFPASLVEGFTDADCAASADALILAEEEYEYAQRAALDSLQARSRLLRGHAGQLGTRGASPSDADDLIELRRAKRRAFKTGFVDSASRWIGAVETARLRVAEFRRDAALASATQSHARALAGTREFASNLVEIDALREAMAWQNPSALKFSIDRLRGDGHGSEGKRRGAESLLAFYLQRYCVKNDSIGFFGPMAWARFEDEAYELRRVTREMGIEQREVFFEDWALAQLATKWSSDRRTRPWQVPRIMDHLRWDGTLLHLPAGDPIPSTAQAAAVLSLCDGIRHAALIAKRLVADPFGDFMHADEVYAVLEQLAGLRRIDWRFEVRVGDPRPEQHLRSQAERIDDAGLRCALLVELGILESKRQAVREAAGRSADILGALDELALAFEQITGTPASRHAGQTYGARSVAYEDCRRELSLALGTSLRESLQAPLDLVLSSARWFCFVLAARMRAALQRAFDESILAAAVDAGAGLPLATYWPMVHALFQGDALETSDLERELALRWERIFDGAGADAEGIYDVDALRPRVLEAFQAPHCGWRSACHQSPDVMVASASMEDFQQGRRTFVLGELHMGINTLMSQACVNQHPVPSELLHALHADLGAPRCMPLFSREGARQPIRVQTVARAGVDVELCFAHDARPLDPASALSVGEARVCRTAGELRIVRSDDSDLGEFLDVFGELMSAFAVNQFRLFAPRPHTPRVTMGALVVQRETWRMDCGALDRDLRHADNELSDFLLARRWRMRHGLPERVFVKLAWEKKPFYIDFASPVYVRSLIRMLRARPLDATGSGEFSVTEALPGVSDTWLSDASGDRFTCELRVVAIQEDDCRRVARENNIA